MGVASIWPESARPHLQLATAGAAYVPGRDTRPKGASCAFGAPDISDCLAYVFDVCEPGGPVTDSVRPKTVLDKLKLKCV